MCKRTHVGMQSVSHSVALQLMAPVDRGKSLFVYQVGFIEFKKTSEPPHYHTLCDNEMKRTMKDNNERWLSESRLSLRKLGKGLPLKS